MTSDPDGRYHLVPQAVFPPGVDLLTGSATGPLVDTGLQIDLDPFVSYDLTDPRGRDQVQRYKRVYLHPDTIRELAQVADIPVRTDEEMVEEFKRGYDLGKKHAREQYEEEQGVTDVAGLADRVDRLLRALESPAGGDVADAAEPAEAALSGAEPSDGDGRPVRRARSGV